MSVIGDALTTWKRRFTIIVFLLLFGILAPLATVMVISTIIILPMFIFGLDLTFWDKSADEIGYLAFAVLGPYYIGANRDEIQKTIHKIFNSSAEGS